MLNVDPFAPYVALECPPGTDYDEDAFLYFLAVERARAERANRPLRLVVATFEPVPGKPVPVPPATAPRLFDALRSSVRETDVTGWYRQHRVAGAILNEHPDGGASDTAGVIQRRVDEGLRRQLPARLADSLRVRVIQLPRSFGSA